MRLLERDLKVLYALDKLRVLDISLISSLVGFNKGTCKNRMKVLYDEGYVKYYQETVISKRYYTISKKGMNLLYPPESVISKSGKKYKKSKKAPSINKRTLNHEIMVATVLDYILKGNNELSIDDFETERDLQRSLKYQKIKRDHFCDLLCKKYRIKIEVELSVKQKSKLSQNILLNTSNYVQIWIVSNNILYKRLLKEKNYFLEKYVIEVIRLEDIENKKICLSKLYDELLNKLKKTSNISKGKSNYEQLDIFFEKN